MDIQNTYDGMMFGLKQDLLLGTLPSKDEIEDNLSKYVPNWDKIKNLPFPDRNDYLIYFNKCLNPEYIRKEQSSQFARKHVRIAKKKKEKMYFLTIANPTSNPMNEEFLIQLAKKLKDFKKFSIIRVDLWIETHKSGLPHLHAKCYTTNTKHCGPKYIQTQLTSWGCTDEHVEWKMPKTKKHLENINKYDLKEDGTKLLLE